MLYLDSPVASILSHVICHMHKLLFLNRLRVSCRCHALDPAHFIIKTRKFSTVAVIIPLPSPHSDGNCLIISQMGTHVFLTDIPSGARGTVRSVPPHLSTLGRLLSLCHSRPGHPERRLQSLCDASSRLVEVCIFEAVSPAVHHAWGS